MDLLRENDAPFEIYHLSIDTEGSEFEILSRLDFSAYRVRVITVEHNFTPVRERLRKLLESHGYVRKLEVASHVDV